MTIYYRDFSNDTTGVAPSGFTKRWVDYSTTLAVRKGSTETITHTLTAGGT